MSEWTKLDRSDITTWPRDWQVVLAAWREEGKGWENKICRSEYWNWCGVSWLRGIESYSLHVEEVYWKPYGIQHP